MDDLAAALSAGGTRGVDFAGGESAAKKAATEFAEITDGVGDAKVSVGRVSTDGDRATGELAWRWTVGSKTWSYDSSVRLIRGTTAEGDAWLVRWEPSVVEPSLEDGRACSSRPPSSPNAARSSAPRTSRS